jgi:hypothetical protein
MRTGFLSLCVTSVLAMSLFLVGCGSDSTATPTDKSNGPPSPPASGADHGDQAGHAHPTEGPHGGHLIELGNEEYHAELLHDENTHTVTFHLLDGPGEQAVAVPLAEITLQLFQGGQFVPYALKAVQGPGDAAGAASRFEIVDAALCDALCHGKETRGRLQATIDGKPYIGTIEHTDHGDHDDEGDDHADHEH